MKYASHVLLMDSLTLSRRTKCPFLNNGRVFLDTNPDLSRIVCNVSHLLLQHLFELSTSGAGLLTRLVRIR